MVGDDMKTIGLIGGMSWESTLEYYRIINETMKAKLGRFHSAKLILYSVDFDEVEILQHQGKWDELTAIMIDAARRVKKGGAEFLLICTNTMHKMAEDIENEAGLPLLHIVDAAAEEIKSKNIRKAGLLGTKFTMEEDFYKERLHRKHDIDVIIPEKRERDTIHRILYNELCQGEIKDTSRNTLKKIIENLVGNGAEGIILGCTEIPLLVRQEDYGISLFDTTSIHARAAVEYAIY
jgi:aspartate racemase